MEASADERFRVPWCFKCASCLIDAHTSAAAVNQDPNFACEKKEGSGEHPTAHTPPASPLEADPATERCRYCSKLNASRSECAGRWVDAAGEPSPLTQEEWDGGPRRIVVLAALARQHNQQQGRPVFGTKARTSSPYRRRREVPGPRSAERPERSGPRRHTFPRGPESELPAVTFHHEQSTTDVARDAEILFHAEVAIASTPGVFFASKTEGPEPDEWVYVKRTEANPKGPYLATIWSFENPQKLLRLYQSHFRASSEAAVPKAHDLGHPIRNDCAGLAVGQWWTRFKARKFTTAPVIVLTTNSFRATTIEPGTHSRPAIPAPDQRPDTGYEVPRHVYSPSHPVANSRAAIPAPAHQPGAGYEAPRHIYSPSYASKAQPDRSSYDPFES
ncbi:hypothetical protein CMUS01_11170 [Colletotrichum musicola]|uniref:Uncharacterized protein n=1 Tax=Colletotrichum musicola TaxID=2175873 RepID=A0A8H6K002_9PEZI|nr:hypothetical protein CMUS01_11170 [Colletotrichum musicola]